MPFLGAVPPPQFAGFSVGNLRSLLRICRQAAAEELDDHARRGLPLPVPGSYADNIRELRRLIERAEVRGSIDTKIALSAELIERAAMWHLDA